MCPESGQAPQECCLRVSLMPVRLNIDQVKEIFLFVLERINDMYSMNTLSDSFK